MKRPSMGELEFLTLFAVGQLGDEAYGAELRRYVSARRDRDYSVGAIYATLQRLEDKDLLMSEETDPLPVRGGRSRRRFRLTTAGRAALRQAVDSRRRFWTEMDLEWRHT